MGWLHAYHIVLRNSRFASVKGVRGVTLRRDQVWRVRCPGFAWAFSTLIWATVAQKRGDPSAGSGQAVGTVCRSFQEKKRAESHPEAQRPVAHPMPLGQEFRQPKKGVAPRGLGPLRFAVPTLWLPSDLWRDFCTRARPCQCPIRGRGRTTSVVEAALSIQHSAINEHRRRVSGQSAFRRRAVVTKG